MRRAITLVALLSLVAALGNSSSSVMAQNETPSSYNAMEMKPFLPELGDRPQMYTAATNQGYSVNRYIGNSPSVNPTPTIADIKDEMGNYDGLFFLHTHGGYSSTLGTFVEIEGYPPGDGGALRDTIFTHYQPLYGNAIVRTQSTDPNSGAVIHYGISIRYSQTVPYWYNGSEAIVHIQGCDTASPIWVNQVDGARFACGDADTCSHGESVRSVREFWERMDGRDGIASRPASQAVLNAPELTWYGQGNTTLAPVVKSISAAPYAESPLDITWEFDTRMNTNTSGVLSVDQTLEIQQPTWLSDTKLKAHVRGYHQRGTGTVRLDPFWIYSANNAQAELDGNTNPYNTNGRGPGRDPYEIPIRNSYNPFANVERFRIVNGTAKWLVTGEAGTAGYLLEGSQSLTGPWTQIGNELPSGLGWHTVDISSSGFSYVRLIEVETSGDRIVEAGIEQSGPGDPTGLPTSRTRNELVAELDSLTEAREGATVEGNGKKYVIFTPEQFFSDVQNYVASYWQSQGYTVEVISTAGFPSDPTLFRSALKATIQNRAAAGAKYFHLIGDWDDWREWTVPAVYQSLWVSGWEFYRQNDLVHYPTQPENDIIPTYVVADTVPRGANMAYQTPYYFSDVPYADTNNDGSPDVVVTRWPLTNSLSVLNLALKMQRYNDLPAYGGYRAAVLVDDYGAPQGSNDGALARALGDSVAARIPHPPNTLYRLNASSYPGNAARAAVLNLWNTWVPELFVYLGSQPGTAFFYDNFQNQIGYGITPVVIGATCYGGDWAGSEYYDGSTRLQPLNLRMLAADRRGAVAWLGPTRATWGEGNAAVATYTAEEIFGHLDRPVAESWLQAMRRVHTNYTTPATAHVLATADSYVFLGDPLTRLRNFQTVTDVAEQPTSLRLSLRQNAPNPFNPTTRIAFSTTQKGPVSLRVYDVAGRLVRTLVEETLPPGRYGAEWDGIDNQGRLAASGMYVYRLEAESRTFNRKMLLLK